MKRSEDFKHAATSTVEALALAIHRAAALTNYESQMVIRSVIEAIEEHLANAQTQINIMKKETSTP